jgi:dolichyl-phosphate-mannose-protein mannosyltransferase
MSANVRIRRPASPPLRLTDHHAAPPPRFPHPRDGHLDADERRVQAASLNYAPNRKSFPSGGLKITSGEWKLLTGVMLVAMAVRLFRLSKPNSVV